MEMLEIKTKVLLMEGVIMRLGTTLFFWEHEGQHKGPT